MRLALPGRIVLVSAHIPCLVDNLSLTGASVSIGSHAPPVGNDAVLIVNGIEVFGTVIWHKDTHFGLQFEDLVTHEDLVRLRAIHDHFAQIETERLRRSARHFVRGHRV